MLFGVGVHLPQAEGANAFVDNTTLFGNREIFFEITSFSYSFTPSTYISLSCLLDWDAYRLNSDYYWLPNNRTVAPAAAAPLFSEVKKSTLRVVSFDFPLMFTQKIGPVSLSVGAAAEINFNGRTKFKGTLADGTAVKNTREGALRCKNIKTEIFTYNYQAILGTDDYAVYVKYNPASQFVDGPYFSYWTVGLILR